MEETTLSEYEKMEALVTIQSDTGYEQVSQLSAFPLTIGREADCHVCLDEPRVSRRHAIAERVGDTLRIRDTSTNGTRVGDMLLHRTETDAPFGTPIKVGGHTVTIMLPANDNVPTGTPRQRDAAAPARNSPPPRRTPVTPSLAETSRKPAQAERQSPFDSRSRQSLDRGTPANTRVPADTEDLASPSGPYNDAPLRRRIHEQLLEQLDLASMDLAKTDDPSLRPKVIAALRRILAIMADELPPGLDRQRLIGELSDEALGLGPLEELLNDPNVSEIMVVDPDSIYVESGGKLFKTNRRFTDDERVRAVIERIVTPLGRRIDESSPLVDARLKDGSRVNAVIAPVALRGSCITVRKFAREPLTLQDLIAFGSLTESMGRFLNRSVLARKNIVVSGGTGSGKTTLLNVLSGAIPDDERIVTIEDAAELQLLQPHVVGLESRPANMEGKGEYTIRDLLKNAMRMRPDRIIVGECRGNEALDMLQAMNTGHDGSLTTTHANSPQEAISRLETLVLMSGLDLPLRAIRSQIANSVDLVVQQARFSDGSRRVTAISEALLDSNGNVTLLPIFEFERTASTGGGEITGEYRTTGYVPTFIQEFIVKGLVNPGTSFL